MSSDTEGLKTITLNFMNYNLGTNILFKLRKKILKKQNKKLPKKRKQQYIEVELLLHQYFTNSTYIT